MTSITLKTPKPRNPLVALARKRRAGKHAMGGGAVRQASRRALERELSSTQPARAKPPSL